MREVFRLSLEGKLVCRYLEDGSKASAYFIKLDNGVLVPTDIVKYTSFSTSCNVNGFLITSPAGKKSFDEIEEAEAYVFMLLGGMGYKLVNQELLKEN